MSNSVKNLLNTLKDPIKEMGLIREGINIKVVESFLNQENFLIKDILAKLQIPASTYFSKKKNQQTLDAYTTEKFFRLISILNKASDMMGKDEAKAWLYRKIPSLGNEAPINLLDTEVGHRLVEQVLLQIQYGIYS
jgi:putative toxin-antitoxin system antitoxin component (TIGR02293 family)